VAATGVKVGAIAPIVPGAAPAEVIEGIEVRRFRYSLLGREALATGVSGILANLRAKPYLAIQVVPLVTQMTRAAIATVSAYDVVHAHWMYPTGWVGLRAARRVGIPIVVTAHGGDVNSAIRTPGLANLVRYVGNTVDKVLTVSDDLAGKLVSMGVESEQIEVVPLGVDPPTVTVERSPTNRPTVVFVGSLIRRKGVATLLRALERVPHDLLEVEILGDGPERDQLEQMSRLVAPKVEFRGEVPPADVTVALAAADVVVLPSHSEGRPVVVMEAMAAEIPVIATDVPGTRELVRNEQTGLLFEPEDHVGLSEALCRLAADADLRHELGRAGKDALVDLGLTGREAANRHVAVYRRVLRPGGSRSRRGRDRLSMGGVPVGPGLVARVDRLRRSSVVTRWTLGLAAVGFVVGLVVALSSTELEFWELRWPALAAAILVGVPGMAIANAAEYNVAAAIEGKAVGLAAAMRIAVLSTAANLLPLPGGPIVRAKALADEGVRGTDAALVTILMGAAWLATSLVVAGLVGGLEFSAAVLVSGIGLSIGIGVALALRSKIPSSDRRRLIAAVGMVELAATGATALRMWLVAQALGFDIGMGAFVLGLSPVLGAIVFFIPAGLGVREMVASLAAPAVGLDPAAGFLIASVDRLVGMAVHGTAAMFFALRASSESVTREVG
jgi:glycosyltransferase involved in cell wall biosynthesis